MAIIISDIHGDINKAKAFLAYKPETEHVILGDLMDSRDYGVTLNDELECLELIFPSNAVLIWGNHDLAYTDKPCWEPYAYIKDTYPTISELIIPQQNRFKAAHAVDGWLCTHAGISTKLAKQLPGMPLDSGNIEEIAAWLNDEFQREWSVPRQKTDQPQHYGVGLLFSRHFSRGGNDQFGGVFGYDPQWELTKPDSSLKQLFGHTPVSGPFKRDAWNNINIEGGCWVFDTTEDDFVMLDEKALVEQKYDIAELVDGISPENRHDFSETDLGDPVGREKL